MSAAHADGQAKSIILEDDYDDYLSLEIQSF